MLLIDDYSIYILIICCKIECFTYCHCDHGIGRKHTEIHLVPVETGTRVQI